MPIRLVGDSNASEHQSLATRNGSANCACATLAGRRAMGSILELIIKGRPIHADRYGLNLPRPHLGGHRLNGIDAHMQRTLTQGRV